MTIAIEIKGIKETIENVRKYNERINKKMPQGLGDAAIYLRNKIVEDIARKQWKRADGSIGPSVDTGLFMNTIKFGIIDKNTVSVSSDMPYSKWLEYGTSPLNKKLFSGPRRHFGRTVDQEKKNILKKFRTAISMM